MSLLIKGMKMPENCYYCELMAKTEDGEYMKCPLVGFKYSMHDMYTYVSEQNKPHAECPLVALPEHHGRLIDADELIFRIKCHCGLGGYLGELFEMMRKFLIDGVNKQPTIIEAEVPDDE